MAEKTILIKNGRVFDGESYFCGDVYVKGGKIAAMKSDVPDTADIVFDAREKTVVPGLIDIHAHILGISSDQWGTPADSSFFPFGVTAAADGGAVKGTAALADSFMMRCGVFLFVGVKDDRAQTANAKKLLDAYGDKVMGLKTMYDATDPNVKTLAPLKEAVAFAEECGLPLTVHCNHSPTSMESIVDVLRRGDILTHIFHGDRSICSENDYAAFKKAREKGVILDAGMAGCVHTDFAVLKAAVAAGYAPDVVSTDITKLSAFTRGGKYGLTLCMSIMRAAGVSEEKLLPMVTVNAAAAVGKSGEWGVLRVGGDADIAVLEYGDHPFDYNENGNAFSSQKGYDCVLTVCKGLVVYKR